MHGVLMVNVNQGLESLHVDGEAEGGEENAANQHGDNVNPSPAECVPQPLLPLALSLMDFFAFRILAFGFQCDRLFGLGIRILALVLQPIKNGM